MVDCDRWFAVAASHLAPTLVAPDACSALEQRCRALPGDLLTALEVRLHGAASSAVDVAWRIESAEHARRCALRCDDPHLQRTLTRWARDVSSASSLAPTPSTAVRLWLEQDAPHPAPRRDPAPLRPIVCAETPSLLSDRRLHETLLPSLAGHALTRAQRRTLTRLRAAMRPFGPLLYAFSLRARCDDAGPNAAYPVRLEFLGAQPARAVDGLRAGGAALCAMAARLDALLTAAIELHPPFLAIDLPPRRHHLAFDVDADGGLAPHIGLETSLRAGATVHSASWRSLFDGLVEAGVADPVRAAAVLAWPGVDSPATAPQRWPARTADDRASGPVPGTCIRVLSHVKRVHRDGQAPFAKVYLLFRYRPPQRQPR
ncbi:MAG: hypothetical protein AAF772_04335 [Acidobacteriota bacterium]